MRKYTKEDIIKKVMEALKKPSTLYKQGVFNYLGSVDGERYTEIAAQEIIYNLTPCGICGIKKITRQESYKVEGHENRGSENANREEDRIAKDMYGQEYDRIGKILDFQVPLKDKNTDEAGKIDLLSYNEHDKTAYILELKKPKSKETLLRCALEAYTYWKTANREKLLYDFARTEAELCKAVLLFENSYAYNEYVYEISPSTIKLMKMLGVRFFGIKKFDIDYEIFSPTPGFDATPFSVVYMPDGVDYGITEEE